MVMIYPHQSPVCPSIHLFRLSRGDLCLWKGRPDRFMMQQLGHQVSMVDRQQPLDSSPDPPTSTAPFSCRAILATFRVSFRDA